jgi:hypothetical protein
MQFFIFPLLGPLIGSVTFHIVAWANGAGPQSIWPERWVFVAGYMLGFFPAFLTGICDALLSTKLSRWRRIPVTACTGYVLSASMALLFYAPPYVTWTDVSVIGAFGVFPAIVCSWVSGRAA